MVFIWRGFGIVVPIIFGISAWITSYWFEDVTLGNTPYIGWSMLWAGIALILFALMSFGGNVDENGEPTGEKSHNDFFWIPIWIWCLAFIGGSIYLINQDGPESSNHDYSETEYDSEDNSYASESTYASHESAEERNLYLYNCASDSIKINITETETDGSTFNFYVQGNDYEYVSVVPNGYTVKMNDYEDRIHLGEADKRDDNDYGDAWMVLCADIDLVVVNVTEVCNGNITAEEVATINWERNVVERFHGDALIEPVLRSKDGGEVRLIAPNTYLPQELENNQSVYVLIPIDRPNKVTEDFLDEEIIELTIRD